MARLVDAILSPKQAYGGHSGAINLRYGGQFGLMPRIGAIGTDGKHYAEYISTHAYVRKNVIPIVLDYPRGFDHFPNSKFWIDAYKNMIETIPISITGLQSGLTVESDSHPIGGAGEVMEEITDVKRATSTLSFTYKERAGKSINKFFDILIRYLYMDPDQKRPLIPRLWTRPGLDEVGGMYTPDFYTGTVLFIEPDTTMRVVVDSWLCTHMFFKSNGERTGSRNITSAGELVEHSIESSCITMCNESVKILADKILSGLTILNSVPDVDMHIPAEGVDPNLGNTASKSEDYKPTDSFDANNGSPGFNAYQDAQSPGPVKIDNGSIPGI